MLLRSGKITNKREKILVFFKTFTEEKTLCLDVCKADKVIDVKRQFEKGHLLPVECQFYIFGGKRMEDDRDLASYNVQKESTILIATRLTGGMMHQTSGRKDLDIMSATLVEKCKS